MKAALSACVAAVIATVTFTQDAIFTGDELSKPGVTAAGYMDDDVAPDIVTSSSNLGMVILRQGTVSVIGGGSKPDGTFTIEKLSNYGSPSPGILYCYSNDAELHDFNDDGDLDIVTVVDTDLGGTNVDAELVIMRNDGYGVNWFLHSIYESDKMEFAHDVEIADFDADGEMDVAINFNDEEDNPQKTEIWVFYHPSSWNSTWSATKHVGTLDAKSEWGLFAADIDGDQKVDLVAHDKWYKNPGNRTGSWSKTDYTSENPSTIFAADIDQDGKVDIATIEGHSHRDGEGDFYLHFQSGTNQWTNTLRVHQGEGEENPPVDDDDAGPNTLSVPEGVIGLDYEGDGKIEHWYYPELGDFQWNSSGGRVWEAKIDFSGSVPYAVASGWPKVIDSGEKIGHQIGVFDMDDDGDLDLLLHNVGTNSSSREAYAIFYAD